LLPAVTRPSDTLELVMGGQRSASAACAERDPATQKPLLILNFIEQGSQQPGALAIPLAIQLFGPEMALKGGDPLV